MSLAAVLEWPSSWQKRSNESHPARSASPTWTKKRILVIDDDLPLRGMLAAALRQHGFQVLLAGDGAEGQRALTIHKPDVVLLDLAMPNVNGWDFLQRLRETGHLGTTPIIVVSAHLRVDPQAVLQMGVSAILPKPFNLPDLINLIEHLSP